MTCPGRAGHACFEVESRGLKIQVETSLTMERGTVWAFPFPLFCSGLVTKFGECWASTTRLSVKLLATSQASPYAQHPGRYGRQVLTGASLDDVLSRYMSTFSRQRRPVRTPGPRNARSRQSLLDFTHVEITYAAVVSAVRAFC
jgi:hypothetical protein